MYLPQRQEGAIDLETLPDIQLRRGLCAKSGGKLEVCRKCGAPCSFGRILMERQDSGTEVEPQARAVNATVSPDERKKEAEGSGRSAQWIAKEEDALQKKRAAYMREYYKRNKERIRENQREKKRREYEAKHAERVKAREARHAALQAQAERTDLDAKHAFGARLELAMYEQGMTQADVGRQIGLTRSMVGLWARGQYMPDAERVERLGKILRVSPEWLLGLEVRS